MGIGLPPFGPVPMPSPEKPQPTPQPDEGADQSMDIEQHFLQVKEETEAWRKLLEGMGRLAKKDDTDMNMKQEPTT
jgi:hypothetical protein